MDGTTNSKGNIIWDTDINLQFPKDEENVCLMVLNLGQKQIILGMPGLKKWNPVIVTISFLYHVFFLISVVCHPYFCFASLYKISTYLPFHFTLPHLLFLFSIALFYRTVSLLSYFSHGNYVSPTFPIVL